MDRPSRHYYEFDSFRIDIGERRLLSGDNPVQLTPKVFDVLLTLVESSGHTLEKDELMRRVWADSFVDEGNLNRNISTLRKVLNDDPVKPRFIKTAPKRGYAFVGEVKEVWEDDEALVVENRTRYHLKVSEQVSRGVPAGNLRFFVAAGLLAVIAAASLAWVWNRSQTRSSAHAADPEASELYHRGRALWQTRAGKSLHEATVLLERAVERDPGFPLAHAALADAYAFDYSNWKKAEGAAREAMRIDPTIGEPHASIGFVRMFWEWNLREAESQFKQSIQKDPGYATVHQWYAVLLIATDRKDAGLAEINTAIGLEPDSISINADLCHTLYLVRRYDDAIAQCQITLAMDGDFYDAHRYLYDIFNAKGMYEEAVNEHLKAEELAGSRSAATGKADAREVFDQGGIRAFWRWQIKRLHTAVALDSQIARHYARLGERSQAVRYLHAAYEKHDVGFLLFYADPVFDDLRRDPRYEELFPLLNPPEN